MRFALPLTIALTAPLAAQTLDLTVTGGSVPGQVDLELEGGTPGLQGGMILLSLTAGPTPLALIDPLDPRSLRVGLDLVDVTQFGPFLGSGVFTAPSIPVPNQPSLVDAPLFFHGLSTPGFPRVVDLLSEPRAFRFGLADSWRDRNVSMSQPLQFMTVLPDGHRTIIAGGSNGAIFAQVAVKTTEVYDPLTDSFSNGPDMTVERSMHTATELLDGRWLLTGGVTAINDPQTTAEIWDPAARTFTAVASMRTMRMGHAAALLPDGRVIVSGGITDLNQTSSQIDPIYSTTRSTEIYDPATDTWTNGPQMSHPRVGHGVIARDDGKVLHMGGVGFRRIIINLPWLEDTTDLFDPSNNSMTAGPTLRQGRAVFASVEVSTGRHLLSGGVGALSITQLGTPTDRAEIYDEASNTFTSVASMSQARFLHAAYDLGNDRFLHIAGGIGSLFAVSSLASTEIYDAANDTWTAGPTLTRPRNAFGSYRTPTGQIHVLGGTTSQNTVSNLTEFFYK